MYLDFIVVQIHHLFNKSERKKHLFINIDVVSLFADLSFLFLTILYLYCINILYQFE